MKNTKQTLDQTTIAIKTVAAALMLTFLAFIALILGA